MNRKEQKPRGQKRNTARGRENREPQQWKGQEDQKQLQTEPGRRPTETKARKLREETSEHTECPEKPSQETETRHKPRVERRRKHTRNRKAGSRSHSEYLGQEEAADDKNQERRAQDELTGKGIEKPRVKESTQRRATREETVEQPIGQREAGCRAAGKVTEAPTKPQGTE